MAKSKKINLEVSKDEVTHIPQYYDNLEDEKEVVTSEGELKEAIGITEAEKLQKGGWQLIDCHLTPEGKKYKFRKV